MPKIELTDCFAFVFSGILMGLGLYHLISASQDAPYGNPTCKLEQDQIYRLKQL